jgi:hypothetical protein
MIANKLRSGSNQPTKEYTASGALANGDLVILNADNTVSVVEGSTTTITQSTGSATTFDTRAEFVVATFDSNSNKVVIAYQDFANSNYGTAVVGTVSGTSISFGTPVVFKSGHSSRLAITFDSNSNKVVITVMSYPSALGIVGTVSGTSISFGSGTAYNGNTGDSSATFDSNSNKVVIAFMDYSGYPTYGKAIVGTVSGTSISFGSKTTFHSNNTLEVNATFDSSSNKVVVSWKDNTNFGRSRVGTVSGTSISFGTEVGFSSTTTFSIASTFDSNLGKVVIAYRVTAADNGRAIVGTVSSTAISFGSYVSLNAGKTEWITAAFDSSVNKVVIFYHDKNNSNKKTARVGTVSGTSITFGSEVVVDPDSYLTYTTLHQAAVFDSNSNRVVIAYKDENNSDYGTARVWRSASTVTTVNLTASNFVGISDGAYANGATATIQMNRATDNAQSGLTAGSTYYAQTDGTLSTTADSPSVLVGAARTTTSIKIKGSNA